MTLLSVLSFLRGNWRWMLPLAACLAVFIAIGFAHYEHGEAKAAKEAAKVAEKQSQNSDNALKATERVIHTETVIREKTVQAVEQVRKTEGYNEPLPADLRSAVCTGIASVQHGEPACRDRDPGDSERGVPEAD